MILVLSNDTEIITLLKNRNQRAMAVILEKYGDQLYSFIYKQLQSEQLASDTLKRTIILVWNTSSEYDKAPEHFFIWLLMKANKVSKGMEDSLIRSL